MKGGGAWARLFSYLMAVWSPVLCGCFSSDRPVRSEPEHWDTTYMRDYSYCMGRLFDLAYPDEIGPYDSVQVYVFEYEPRRDNPEAKLCYLDAGQQFPYIYDMPDVLMKEVPQDQWEPLYGQDTAHCPVALVFHSEQRYGIGVKMQIFHFGSDSVTTIGYTDPIGKDTLRIVQPTSERQTSDHPAWELAWRNCYRIPKIVFCDDIQLKVRKGPAIGEGSLDYQVVDGVAQDPYIQILGLDQYNNRRSNVKVPDGKLDCWASVLRPDWGLVIFPEREPFNSNRCFEDANGVQSDTLVVKVPTLYHYNSVTEKFQNSTYYLEVRHRTD